VANVDESMKGKAIEIAERLRKEGISVQTDLMKRSLTKQLEYADSVGIPFVVVVGRKEIEKKRFRLKDMEKKTETEAEIEKIIEIVKSFKSS
jgi:histidyl-tRNA synthetase